MILFNRFGSAIKFYPTIATVLSPNTLERELEAGGKLDDYEIEGPDRGELLHDLSEFQLASVRFAAPPLSRSFQAEVVPSVMSLLANTTAEGNAVDQTLYNALLENNCSEQASRMAAMESSTKNASEMLQKLTLTYNRCEVAKGSTDKAQASALQVWMLLDGAWVSLPFS